MNQEQLMRFITEHYGVDGERPWIKNPTYAVFRHQSNQKWFALLMEIPKSKLGLEGNELIQVLNLKCDPILMGSLLEEKGVYPAYHMNKASWITIALDGSMEDDRLKWLLDLSYDLTAAGKRRSRASRQS